MSLPPLAAGSALALSGPTAVEPTAGTKAPRLLRIDQRWLSSALSGWLALGCAVPAVEDAEQAEEPGLHALVRVSREQEGEAEQTTALSAFVRAKPGEEIDDLLTLTNPELGVPETAGCRLRTGSLPAVADPKAALPEFLLADSVILSVAGAPFELTPYAFPRVGGQMGGALYSTRRLPAPASSESVKYKLSVRGLSLDGFVPLEQPEGVFELPVGVRDVSISGTPFESLESVSLNAPIDLTWTPLQLAASPRDSAGGHGVRPGFPRPDWVVIDLESRDQTLSCAFPTTDAAGSIAESHLREFAPRTGETMTLSVRLAGVRSAQAVAGFDSLRVRFEVTTRRAVTAAF